VKEEVFSEEDVERYVEAWSQPRALTAGINDYRANIKAGDFHERRSLEFSKGEGANFGYLGEGFRLNRGGE